MLSPLLGLLLLVGAALGLAGLLPEGWSPWVIVPAVLWAPGAGFARALGGDPVRQGITSVVIAGLGAAAAVWMARVLGLGAAGVLAGVTTVWALGHSLPARETERGQGWMWGGRWAALLVLLAIPLRGSDWVRPLEAHWWAEEAEADFSGTLPGVGTGWKTPVEGEGVLQLFPRRSDPELLGPMDGELWLVFQGPVGATMGVGSETLTIRADVTVNEEEGPVPRYQGRGVAAVKWTEGLQPAEPLWFRFSQPEDSSVYLISSGEALWDLHAAGRLRFVHYYQILNMVEQLRWAEELLGRRTVTDVQPPGWSYLLAGPLALAPGLPTANVVMLLYLLFGVFVGFQALQEWKVPPSRVAALLLPALGIQHARLMLEPGSGGLPDSLYAITMLGMVGSLAGRGFSGWMLAGQLLRYPASAVGILAALLAGQPLRLLRALALVVGVAGLFGIYGWASGQLDGWLATVAWETGPEHWHGETNPTVLLSRAPEFYALWLGYSGGIPLLAALAWPGAAAGTGKRGAAVALGTAGGYSLLLCTIDHFPSHYFLPLLWLSGLALLLVSHGSALRRLGLPILALIGLLLSALCMPII